MTHPKVLPFRGIIIESADLLVISNPMPNLRDHIGKHPDTDRLGIVGGHFVVSTPRLLRQQLSDAARASIIFIRVT